MKRIKELTMSEVITLIEQCKFAEKEHNCDNTCPLFYECLYYYTGDDDKLYEND